MSAPRSRRREDENETGLEIGSDGVDAVIGLGNGMNVGTDGEVGVSLGGGVTMEMDGDLRIGGINLTGD